MSQVKVTAMKISTYWRDRRDPAPAHVARHPRAAEEKDVDGGDGHHREEDREDLRHGEPDPDRRLDEVAVDAEEDDEHRDRRKDRELRRMALLRPRHRRDLAGPAVEEEAHEGGEDQDVDGGVLGGHDPQEAEHRVRRSSHRPDLGDGRDDRSRRRPDHEADRDRDEQVFDDLLDRLPSLDPPHPEPEVVVGGEEEVPDQDGLDDEEPREGPAHHRESERLRVGVDLFREPVAGEGERQEGADRDEVADVSHPVVVRPFLVGLRLQELERGVGGGDRSAEGDVRDDPMDVDRHPGEVVDRVPDGDHRPVRGNPARRHHEREPGVGDEHDPRADDVEAEPQAEMHQRMEFPPAVVVGVEEKGLEEEEHDVGEKRRREHAHQVVRELRVQDDEHERQGRPERRGQREGDREQLRELVGEPVVALVSGLVADRLDDEREDGDGEDERREQQVQLGDHPDGHAAADDGKACGTAPLRRASPRPWPCSRASSFSPATLSDCTGWGRRAAAAS